jgi:hypothetical protein
MTFIGGAIFGFSFLDRVLILGDDLVVGKKNEVLSAVS